MVKSLPAKSALYGIARSIDLKQAAALVPGVPGIKLARRRDTPDTILMPAPLCVDLAGTIKPASETLKLEKLTVQARLYDEGVIVLVLRMRLTASLQILHDLDGLTSLAVGQGLAGYMDGHCSKLMSLLAPAIHCDPSVSYTECEAYTAFCFASVDIPPSDFLRTNAGDLANYQYLGLRALDKQLDTWLDIAEDDIRRFYDTKRARRLHISSLQKKFAVIQALRLDALFVLENIENASKIIGDYFLGAVFNHLCGVFNTPGWTRSVERRLSALQNVYEIVKIEKNERTMLILEIVFIVVCIIPIIQFAFN